MDFTFSELQNELSGITESELNWISRKVPLKNTCLEHLRELRTNYMAINRDSILSAINIDETYVNCEEIENCVSERRDNEIKIEDEKDEDENDKPTNFWRKK